MRGRTVVISALVHVLVFGAAFLTSQRRASRRATSVAIVGEKKKPPPPKREEPPKPKAPPPKPATPKAAPSPLQAAPAPTHAPSAPVETNLEMGNDDGGGPGIALGGAAPARTAPKGETQAPKGETKTTVPKQGKVLGAKADNPENDECNEAPTKPVPVRRSEIEYTQEARANNVEGRMVLRITVGADGSVSDVEIVQKVDPSLDAAVVAAVRTWQFKPAQRCGKPIAGGVYTMAKNFELGD